MSRINVQQWSGGWHRHKAEIALGLVTLLVGIAVGLLPLNQLGLFAAIALALVVVAITFAEPALGLAFTLFAAPFGPLENIMLHLPIESGQLLLILTLTAWLARMLYRRELRLSTGLLVWPLLTFIGVAVLSFFAAQSFELWAKECLKWIEVLAAYVLVVSEIKARPHTLRIFVAAILISTLFEAALGIYQFGLRGEGPDEFAILGGRFFRSYGTFEQPNPFGGYMGLTWPLMAGIALYYMGRTIAMWKEHTARFTPGALRLYALTALTLLITALACIALVLSWSRGAWIGAAAAAVIVFIMALRRPLASLAVLAVIALLAVTFNLTDLLPPSLRDRLTDFTQGFSSLDVRGVNVNDANYSVIERLAHWQAAQNMILDKPYFGVGFGNYGAAYEHYRALNWPNALGHAHNYYLNIFAETGVFGLSAYLILWILIAIHTLRLLLSTQHSLLSTYLALGLLGAWVHLSVHHLFDNLYVANIFLLIGVYFGLLDGMAHGAFSLR